MNSLKTVGRRSLELFENVYGEQKKNKTTANVLFTVLETPDVFFMSMGENTQEVYEIPTRLLFLN